MSNVKFVQLGVKLVRPDRVDSFYHRLNSEGLYDIFASVNGSPHLLTVRHNDPQAAVLKYAAIVEDALNEYEGFRNA